MINENENSEVSWMKLITQSGGVPEKEPETTEEIIPIEIDLVDSKDVEFAS